MTIFRIVSTVIRRSLRLAYDAVYDDGYRRGAGMVPASELAKMALRAEAMKVECDALGERNKAIAAACEKLTAERDEARAALEAAKARAEKAETAIASQEGPR